MRLLFVGRRPVGLWRGAIDAGRRADISACRCAKLITLEALSFWSFSDRSHQEIGKKNANGGAAKRLGFTMLRLEPSQDRQRRFQCPGRVCVRINVLAKTRRKMLRRYYFYSILRRFCLGYQSVLFVSQTRSPINSSCWPASLAY